MSKLWVRYQTAAEIITEFVSFAGCSTVSEFKFAVRNYPDLAIPVNTRIKLYLPDGVTEIDVGDNPGDYMVGNSKETPLVVKATVIAPPITYQEIPFEQQSLQVNVFNQDENNEAAYNSYVEIGLLLKDEPIVKQIWETLKSFNTSPIPFVFIEESSGAGKTQIAFALNSFIASKQPEIKFLYFSCSGIAENTQNIYKYFKNQTNAFLSCAAEDLKFIPASSISDGCRTDELDQKSLYLFGLFYHMLKTPNEEFKPRKMKSKDVKDLGEDVVVVLDEFPAFQEAKSQFLRLLRNITRTLRFKLVVMGTNSTAANLIKAVAGSRTELPVEWCHIFPRLPKLNLASLDLNLQSKDCWIKPILASSRPLFSKLAVNHIQDLISGNIDACFGKVAENATGMKEIFENDDGLHGQVCLFLNVSYSEYSKAPNTHSNSSLIHCHFAHLKETQVKMLNSKTKWHPNSNFPKPSEDFLLSACLMGSRDFYPFQRQSWENKEKFFKLSFCKAVDILKNNVDAWRLKIDPQNTAQSANNGMFLEAVLAGSLIVASRLNGVKGIPLQNYIPAVFAQLEVLEELVDFTIVDTENKSLNEFMKSFKIPFLAPPNQLWPDFVKGIPGDSMFGNLTRTVNKDKIDINSDFRLTGEAKDHAKDIDTTVMNGILSRINDPETSRTFNGAITQTSKVHFVFVNSLQENYFTKRSKLSFTPYEKYCCCAEIEVDTKSENLLHLRDIKGLSKLSTFDFNDDSTLVLFYTFTKPKTSKSRGKKNMKT